MKIAILVSELPPHAIGGTETQSLKMAVRLSKNSDVTIITRRFSGLSPREYRGRLTIRRFRKLGIPGMGFLSQALFSLSEIGRMRRDIGILQCMMIRPNGFIGFLAKKLFGVRYAVWLRGEYRHYGKGRFPGSLMVRAALSNADLILTQTPSIRDEVLEDYPKKRVEVVRNGIDFPGSRSRGNSIIFVGSLIERKGVHNLINALRKLSMEGIRPRTIIVGDGYLRPGLERLARGLDVEFSGRVMPNEVNSYLEKARVLVLPSVVGKGEGLPNVILEAMAMGVPVVASNIAGIPDVIEDGRTGFLVEPGDASALADRIRRILQDDSLHERMSKECLMEIRKYSWDSVIKDLERIYQGMVIG